MKTKNSNRRRSGLRVAMANRYRSLTFTQDWRAKLEALDPDVIEEYFDEEQFHSEED